MIIWKLKTIPIAGEGLVPESAHEDPPSWEAARGERWIETSEKNGKKKWSKTVVEKSVNLTIETSDRKKWGFNGRKKVRI